MKCRGLLFWRIVSLHPSARVSNAIAYGRFPQSRAPIGYPLTVFKAPVDSSFRLFLTCTGPTLRGQSCLRRRARRRTSTQDCLPELRYRLFRPTPLLGLWHSSVNTAGQASSATHRPTEITERRGGRSLHAPTERFPALGNKDVQGFDEILAVKRFANKVGCAR